jgi:site-specific recombinase XerD
MAKIDPANQHWLSLLRDHLREERYHPCTARRCIAVARSFLAFFHRRHISLIETRPEMVERYLELARRKYRQRNGHLPGYPGWRCSHTSGIHMLLRLAHGQWPPAAVTRVDPHVRELCQEYTSSMIDLRGLATETVAGRCEEAHRFLEWLGGRAGREALSGITITDVDTYMKNRAVALRRPTIKAVATRLRAFLRWLHATGRTTRDLSTAVIAPTLYAFEGIPSALRSHDVDRVLSMARRDHSPLGLRDYAILLLLAKYGLRAGEITGLRLDDVDWHKEVIRIRHTKTGATSWLPLLPEVGEAVLKYLQKSRPQTSSREIFVRSRAPYRPFESGSSLYTPIRRRIDAAGVPEGGKRGPHAFRHARAVSMIRACVPLKEIGDVLGHRASDSTLVYLKLATEDLRAVALEIPVKVKA